MPGVPPSEHLPSSAFLLAGLHVDPSTGVVRGPQGEVRLEPRVMAVLEALARRPGELVTRADLLTAIWPGGDVYDEALTQCVYQLRQQLVGVGGAECRDLVSTVPKRGYLLKAEVRPIAPAVEQSAPPPVRSRRRPFAAGLLAAALALIGAWAILEWRDGTDTPPVMPGTDIVAVLPFLPLVEESRDLALELGMADTLIARLSGIRQVVVRPISSVRRYANLERDALRAGRELGADAIVDGSIQRSDEGLRVTARLLRVGDGAVLWADSLHEQSASMFALQDALCERIAAALALEFGQPEQPQPAWLGTSDAEAYEHYLQGRYFLARFTPRDMRAGIDEFRQAVAQDPDYALAWLGLASAQFRISIAGEAPPGEYFPNARAAAQRALEIDPDLAEGYAMLGWIAQWYEWDWSASEAHYRRAIELDPNDTEARLGYGHLLSVTGQHERALTEVRRAREISPFYPVAASLEGFLLMRAQRHEEAIRQLEDARQLNEKFWLIRLHLAEAYLAAGRNEEALEQAQAAVTISGGATVARAREVVCLARLGRADDARALLGDLQQRSAERFVPPYDLAVAFEGVGDTEAALAWLERAHQLRDPKMILLGAGGWESIRGRSEFAGLLQRMGLADPVR